MKSVCPFDLQLVNTDVFLTYLFPMRRENGRFFSFSCYDGECSAFMYLVSQSDNTQYENEKEAMANR